MIDVHDELASALAGRYELERELGHGGMAIVYLARDVKHGRRVAVKVLRPDLASSVGADRFLREIDVAARLTHPNILTLHDSGAGEGGLLYYVMPYVEGETLRDRLQREHQLPIEEALAITRQVGDALDYAHAHGVVHRDIKPENILLMGEHVLVADFGLARALFTASSTRLTESAVTVGTPAYMSPEQAAADPEVDGRADVYSLACVLYEMIAGVPPFRGATAQAVLAQHLTATPPSLCAQRPHCPKPVDAAVQRAMEKVPADRYRTAREFVAALQAPQSESTVSSNAEDRRRTLRRSVGAVVGVTLVVTAGYFGARWHQDAIAAASDSAVFAVLPFAKAGSDSVDVAMSRGTADALGEWEGVDVVEPRRIDEVLGGQPRPLRLEDALDAARSVGANRAVVGDEVRDGDSLRVRAIVYDARDGRELRTARMSLTTAGAASRQLRVLASGLLRARRELPWARPGDGLRPSLEAWLDYDSARAALDRWDLATAEQQLRAATRVDPDLAQAHLWLARVQLWNGRLDDWGASARRAYELRARLAPEDSVAAEAHYALLREDYPRACASFRRLIAIDSGSVAGWYGLGECQSRDQVVVRDAHSPSGYAFRASMEQASHAYMHILDVVEDPQPAFVYARLADVLVTGGNRIRAGHLDGGGPAFGAFPSLRAETLAFVPYQIADLNTAKAAAARRGTAAALERNRAILRRLHIAWAQRAPSSVDAHVALAELLEVTEQPAGSGADALSALTQIRRARMLATDPVQQDSLARIALRLLMKSASWAEAAALADSIVDRARRTGNDSSLSALGAAALTGRIETTARLLGFHDAAKRMQVATPAGDSVALPAAVQQDVARLFAYAALGACAGKLDGLRDRVTRRLESYVGDADSRASMRWALLRRPLSLGVPCAGPSAVLGIPGESDRLILMQQALAVGNRDSVRAIWRDIRASRTGARPGDVPIDYTYLESSVLTSIGDTSAAITHLDQTLEALPTLGAYLLDYPAEPAALVRAMGLRAELAAGSGDRDTARRWAEAVRTLWKSADPELQPYVRRMTTIASSGER